MGMWERGVGTWEREPDIHGIVRECGVCMGTWVKGIRCVGEVEGRDQGNWGRGPSVCEAQRRGRDQVWCEESDQGDQGCVRLKGE